MQSVIMCTPDVTPFHLLLPQANVEYNLKVYVHSYLTSSAYLTHIFRLHSIFTYKPAQGNMEYTVKSSVMGVRVAGCCCATTRTDRKLHSYKQHIFGP